MPLRKDCSAQARRWRLWDMDAAALEKAAAALKSSGRIFTAAVDVTDEASIARATDALIRDTGKIDILVNNAGITGGNAPTWELPPDVWRRVVEVNLDRALSDLPRRRPAYDCGRLWPHRQYRLHRRQGGQSERLALFGIESRA